MTEPAIAFAERMSHLLGERGWLSAPRSGQHMAVTGCKDMASRLSESCARRRPRMSRARSDSARNMA